MLNRCSKDRCSIQYLIAIWNVQYEYQRLRIVEPSAEPVWFSVLTIGIRCDGFMFAPLFSLVGGMLVEAAREVIGQPAAEYIISAEPYTSQDAPAPAATPVLSSLFIL